MTENIFPSAGRKYDAHISRVASENSLFTTQKIDLCASIYGTYQNGSQINTKTCGFASVFRESERVDTETTLGPHNSILLLLLFYTTSIEWRKYMIKLHTVYYKQEQYKLNTAIIFKKILLKV